MLAGTALLGVVTASFASWLLDPARQVEEQTQVATRRDVEALAAQVATLRAGLKAQSGAPPGPAGVSRDSAASGLDAFVPASVEAAGG